MKYPNFEKISLFILLINLFINSSYSYTVIKIGAIFFPGEDDLEQVFSLSISASNRKFYETRLVPVIRYAPADDSILLERLVCDLLSNGTMAIFGPSSKASSDIVESVCNYAGIPHIKFDWNHDGTFAEKSFHKMTINMYPSLQALSKAYSDILLNFGWRQFSLIYQDDIALIRFQDVLELLPSHKSGITKYKLESDEYGTIWKGIKHNQINRIVVDCSAEVLEDVIRSAKDFNVTEGFIAILLTNLDTHTVDLKQFATAMRVNVTALKISVNEGAALPEEQTLTGVVLFDAVQLFSNAIQYLSRYYQVRFTEPRVRCENYRENQKGYSWTYGPNIIDTMKKVQMADDDEEDVFITKDIKFSEFGERTGFSLDIFRPLRQISLATWRSDGVIEPFKSAPKSVQNVESDVEIEQDRRLFKVSGRLGTPYLMERKAKEGEILTGNQRYEGYSVDLIHKLSQQLDFDYTIEIAPDNQWGKLDHTTGEWNGIIRELVDHKADIGICDLTITHERRQAVDFTVPYMQLGISILYYKEPPPDPDLFSFLKPFALEVWIYMATAYLIISILLFLLARIAADEYENPHPCNPNPEELENKWCITNTTWLVMGSLMGQGCDILPRTGPLRIVSALWWFFALMMLNSYTANLAAFLTSSRQQSSIESINDLAEQNKISFGTVNGGSTSTFFKESNDSVYRRAWNKMVQAKPTVFTADNNEGLERVKKSKGLYAFLMETTGLEYITERNCEVQSIGGVIGEKHYGLAVPLGSDYRSNLSVAILKLSEKGELFALKKKWWKGHNVTCEKFETDSNNELGIDNVGGVFLVLGAGLFTAYVIGIFEFLWNVQQVAVEEKITPLEALKEEIGFALKFWINKKPVRTNETISYYSQSRRSSRSRSQSQMQNVNIFPVKE
ncbi:glutamate receptor ionotropic, kainate 2-like [Condylostylus longicornis]|uniref:glutamate receptor ionotropic, kainate 2-like n=1 Tax=Condylostylus longicornis TaxID=2530218 RepID=UPI00244E10C7|nr:glutamate receptor ionotropic, kainate 2-like [Condylostylus longicornis]